MCALKNVEPVMIISTSPSIASPTLVLCGGINTSKIVKQFPSIRSCQKTLCGFGGWDVVDNVVAHIFEDIFKKSVHCAIS